MTSLGAFYFFYTFNALGYVFGGPLPNQVLLSRWFDKGRGKAMGIAYLGIGVGGALVPLLAFALTQAWGWRGALRILGVLMIAIALPMAYFVREPARAASAVASSVSLPSLKNILTRPAFYFLMLGSMASIGAVGGTIQNLALYLSLDRKLPQVEIDTTLSIILAGQRHRPPDDGMARGPLGEEARDVPDLRDRGARPSRCWCTRPTHDDARRSARSCSASASAATT